MFSGRNNSLATQNHSLREDAQVDKAFAGLVLVLAQLSSFIEKTAIPKITEVGTHLIDLDLIIGTCNHFLVSFPFSYHLKSCLVMFRN